MLGILQSGRIQSIVPTESCVHAGYYRNFPARIIHISNYLISSLLFNYCTHRAGGSGRLPLVKDAAYLALAASNSRATDMTIDQ